MLLHHLGSTHYPLNCAGGLTETAYPRAASAKGSIRPTILELKHAGMEQGAQNIWIRWLC